jgi:hypothetical protein
LYQHVLRLEGTREPIDTWENLADTAAYIRADMASHGAATRVQEFRLDGWDDTFANIEGWVGDEGQPAAVIVNHYDTVSGTLGANDNAAGVAVTLEAARVLAQEPDAPTVRFVSSTLEEGLPPSAKLRIRQSARNLGLTDERHRYSSYQVSKLMRRHAELTEAAVTAGQWIAEAMAGATDQLKDQIPGALQEHLAVIQDAYAGVTTASAIGKKGKIGSSAWVDEALHMGKKIAFAICLDEIGITSKQEGSQRLPQPLTYDMMQTFKVDAERKIGDWAFLLADANSRAVALAFCDHCRRQNIDLPHGFFQMPSFEEIAARFPQAFGSDHAPFWRAGIPAIFAFDTSNWRNPYGHSMADSIDRLDFDHITKVCKATIATVVDPRLRL